MTMRKLEYEVRFVTPAFLGNADQNGQWRTPPFKALLRQWWRVAYAAEHDFRVDVGLMRREEGLLFGHAWLDDDHDQHGQKVAARKSLVRVRLDSWKEGQETKAKWGQQDPASQKVSHPEIGNIGPLLYLGYGPLDALKVTKPDQKRPEYLTVLKRNAAIQAGEKAMLSIAVPDEHQSRIEHALWLMDRYGTLGARSRNGWGSLLLKPAGDTRALEGGLSLCPLRKALGLEWPHAVGQDDRGALIWQTEKSCDDWKTLMRELAMIKIGLRTQFTFSSGSSTTSPEHRHWLSYPVTSHSVRAWGNERLPNSLRFKIRPDKAESKELHGVIFHLPCLPPPQFGSKQNAILLVWQHVHELLDELTKAAPRGYTMIADSQRRAALKLSLDNVRLKRISE